MPAIQRVFYYRSLLTICALTLLFSLLAIGPALAEAPEQAKAQAGFTIAEIKADAAKGQVSIRFSQPVNLGVIKSNLRILPRVQIDWKKSRLVRPDLLVLQGEFKYGQRHVISLPEGLYVNGRPYRKTTNQFVMPDLPPRLTYASDKRVIERDSRQMLHLKVVNVDKLLYQSVRVPPILLPLALAASAKGGDPLAATAGLLSSAADQAEAAAGGLNGLAVFLGRPVEEKQLFSVTGETNQVRAFSMPLSFRTDRQAGALELIRVSGHDLADAPATRMALFQITNLGLTYKLSGKNLLVWATSMEKGLPQAGVSILAFTRQMEAFLLGQTKSDGTLLFQPSQLEGLRISPKGLFEKTKGLLEPEQIAYIVAAAPGDVSYLEIKPKGDLQPYGIQQARTKEGRAEAIKGHVFTERGVYRPGDEVMFRGTVRQYKDGRISAPDGLKCSFEVVNSKGQKVHQSEAALSRFGTASGKLGLKTYWPLGTYTLTMRYGQAKEDQASRTFQVLEFRPPRHFAEVSFKHITQRDETYVNQNPEREYLEIHVAGRYYAGGPVKHGQVRWKIYYAGTDYQVKGFEDYTFGHPVQGKGELIESGESVLDEKGRLKIDFPLDDNVISGEHGLQVVATVIDFDGRAASASQVYEPRPEVLVGIASHPDKVSAGVGQALNVIVTKAGGGQVYSGEIEAQVLQKSGVYMRKRNQEGDLYWDYETVWRKVFTTELPIKWGRAAFEFDFAWGGDYQLAFTYRDEAGRAWSSATLYEVTGDFYWDRYFNRKKPYEALPMTADKEAYRPGQTAVINLAPQEEAARFLVTIEQNGVLEHMVVEPQAGQKRTKVEIKIREEYAPNVYISALAITPRGGFPVYAGRYDQQAPGFYFGTINLPVKTETEGLAIEIAREVKRLKAEPGGKVSLHLAVKDNFGQGAEAELAVGVVDESVLALTGYATPTLDSLSRFDLPLGVFTGELRHFLLHQTPFDLVRNEPLTGGGGLAYALAGAQEIKVRKRFDPVAYFNPSVVTGKDGRAEVTFTLPDTMTTYRVYVIACDAGSRFGSDQRPLLAVKDFYLEPGLPRFLTKGDAFSFQVSAFNKTDQAAGLTFEASASGGLKLRPEQTALTLAAQDSTPLTVHGEATAAGPAKALFAGKMGEKADAVEIALPINTGLVLETDIFFGALDKPKEISFSLDEALRRTDWSQVDLSQARCLFTLSGSPFLRMTGAIKYLLRYPYGCVEQTSSGIMALAALRSRIKEGSIPEVSLAEADKYLDKSVNYLLGLQTGSGGFGYWPGYSNPHPWGSVYAGMALNLALQSGFQLPKPALASTWKYLQNQVKSRNRTDAFRAMACYVLAEGGALDRATLSRASLEYAKQSREAQILLALAGRTSGLLNQEEAVSWARDLLSRPWNQNQDDEFSSRYREPALALLLGQAVLPGDKLTDQAALRLLGGLDQRGVWTSTSDTGWSLFALSRYFAGQTFSQETVKATISQPGGRSQSVEFEPREFATVELDPALFLKNPALNLETSGGRTILYRLELTAPRTELALADLSQGFKISKEIENTGQGPIKVGDVVLVKVYVEALSWPYRYIVIDDPLPAGLVAINSALKTEEPVAGSSVQAGDEAEAYFWSPDGYYRFQPNFFEIKDDRVVAFRNSLWKGRYQFSYYARAVCAGRFVTPPTRVGLMYSPKIVGYTARTALDIGARE